MNDSDLIACATGFLDGIQGDKPTSHKLCFMVCAPLDGYLSFLGVESKMVEGEITVNEQVCQHLWIELPDGRILDPTADQFPLLPNAIPQLQGMEKMPRVYLGPKPPWYRLLPAKPDRR